MVIDDEKKYNVFLNENSEGSCIFHVIKNNDILHSAVSTPLALFVKNINTRKVYTLNISHYDMDFKIPKNKIINDLNNLYCNKFVLNKKSFIHILPILNLKDLQLIEFFKEGKIDDSCLPIKGYDFIYSFYKNKNIKDINTIVPLSIHREMFDVICDDYEDYITNFKEDDSYENINTTIIENLQKIEINGLYVDNNVFNSHFKDKSITPFENKVYTEYNIYTTTGRPSNRFGGINYAALKKEDGSRQSFISRHADDGMLLLIDFSAYHPHIVAKLINYSLPDDAYRYLGKYYTGNDTITDEELKAAKNLTFQCMYGNIPTELLDIPYFKKMNDYITHRWNYFNEFGYVETPIYKRRITNKNISDATPNKLFNYILQASETEFGMNTLADINNYLNNKKTKVVLYTYDSLLFDFNKNDGKNTLIDIKKIMNTSGFPVKCYIGNNYDNMISINI
jgi:DNA polymerase I-like protein with 3'-5' exonuclease and polymerase domains